MNEGSDRIDLNADALGRVLAEASDNFVCLANSHGEPFYLNPAGQRLVGLDEDKPASSISLRELYAEESWAELRDVAVPAVNKTGHWEGRSRLRNVQTGDLFDVDANLFRLQASDGRATHLSGISASPDRRPDEPPCRASPRRRLASAPFSNPHSIRSSRSTIRGSSPSSTRRPSRRSAIRGRRCSGRSPRTCFSPGRQRRRARPHRPLSRRRRGLVAGPAGGSHRGARTTATPSTPKWR